MTKFKLSLLLIFASLHTFAQKTPEQIYEKYYAALGGKERLLGIKTLVIKSIDMGLTSIDKIDTITTINYYKRPNLYRVEVKTPKISKLQLIIYNNTKGYFYDSLNNKTLQDSLVNKYSAIYSNFVAHRIIPELYYEETGVKSTYAGVVKVGNKKAYKIICELKGIKWYNFYSVRSKLKIRESQFWNDEFPFNTNISNYKIIGGIKFPFPGKLNIFNMSNLYYSIKINEPIDDEKFKID